MKNKPIIDLYLGKVIGEEINPDTSDKTKVIRYFDCLYGGNMTLIKVYSSPNLKGFCEYNNITKEFVLNTIKNHLKIKK